MTLRTRLSRIAPLDLAMLVLAVVSVALLSWVTFGDVDPAVRQEVFLVDLVICAVFAAEFGWRWRAASWERPFLLRNWYEILGMIPLSHPAVRSFRLIRVIAIVARVARATDAVMGERWSVRLLARVSDPLVEAIKKPITLAVLDEVSAVLRAGHYTKNVAAALEQNRDEIRELVLEKLKADRAAGLLTTLPFHDKAMQATADTTLRITMEVLVDRRMDEFVADVLRENIEQIQADVRRRGVREAVRPVGARE